MLWSVVKTGSRLSSRGRAAVAGSGAASVSISVRPSRSSSFALPVSTVSSYSRLFRLPWPFSHMKRKLESIVPGLRDESTPKKRIPLGRSTPASPMATTTLELTERELRLKNLLLDVAEFIDNSEDHPAEPLVLRWAGGWVRDKLLGQASHDIDTAINSMTGFNFALKMQQFCADPANTQRHGMAAEDLGNLHKVEANPDKSKHLETATVRIFGMDVDFVNLRKETYAADSRNPQMEFGTAQEDALRRDATVNALFYNLKTGLVEDFTGGLRDMGDKRIQTPLEPLQTFTDDPLRVLRLVRFASRLQFAIDPNVEKYMADPRVLDALLRKISRERVGIEVEKMLKGKYPRDALGLIHRLGLYYTIFTDTAHAGFPKPDLAGWAAAYECLDFLEKTKTPGSIYDVLVRTDEAQYFAWMLAAITPFGDIAPPPPPANSKSRPPPPPAVLALREGIRGTNKLCDVVNGAYRHREQIVSLKQAVCDKAPYLYERDRFGMAIREWEARGSNWKLQVLFAVLFDVLTLAHTSGSKDNKDTNSKYGTVTDEERNALLRGWQDFLDHLEALDVQDAPHIKRLLDGKQVAAALGIKPGKWMTAAMDICMAWQLRNPDETDPAGAIEEVRKRKHEIGIADV